MLSPETRREYLSEAFHSLSQPITALQCGLELAIAMPRSQKEYQRRIRDALQSTGSLREMMSALRELVEADDPGEDAEQIDLSGLFCSIHGSVAKIADMHESGFEIQSPFQIRIYGSSTRLARLLLLLCDEVIVNGSVLKLGAQRVKQIVEITVECEGKRGKEARVERTCHDRVREMRMSTADNYIATLGGVLRTLPRGYKIELPMIKT
jgi:signal transduction histidine kinase